MATTTATFRQLELPGVDPTGAPPPRLAEGTDLIGEYEGSGYRDRSYLARRADGQTLRMTPLLYEVARRADGRRTYRDIADELNHEHGSDLASTDIWELVRRHLQPAGIVAGATGPGARRNDALLGLRWRVNLLPPTAVRRAADLLAPLFSRSVVVVVLAAVGALDAWLLLRHGLAQPAADVLVHPWLMAVAFGLIIASGAFHELGHAAACRYGGARPGTVGAGLYVMWPAFFCDVTDAYRLGRAGRLRTDLGGVYFNLIFCLGLAAAYVWTGREFLLAVILLQQVEALHQFFPFLRLDGYYVVADLVGVPDLFQRIRPTLTSFLPGRPEDPRAAALKPFARRVVAGWVVLTVAILAYGYLMLLAAMPRIAATAGPALLHLALTLAVLVELGRPLPALLAAGQLLALALPLAGLVYVMTATASRLLRALWRSAERPLPRAALVLAAVAGGMLLGHSLVVPAHPILRTESGTVGAAQPLQGLPSPAALAPSALLDEAAPPPAPAGTPAPTGTPAATPPTPAPVPAGATGPTPAPSTSPAPTPTPTPTATPTPVVASTARTV